MAEFVNEFLGGANGVQHFPVKIINGSNQPLRREELRGVGIDCG